MFMLLWRGKTTPSQQQLSPTHLTASSCGKSSEKKVYFASSTLLAKERPTNALQDTQQHTALVLTQQLLLNSDITGLKSSLPNLAGGWTGKRLVLKTEWMPGPLTK
jgi:hypothetical protein